MARTNKNSAQLFHTSFDQETTSSGQESVMQVIEQQPSTSEVQFISAIYMPYIEGPKMDWTVNDGLYHRFLEWRLRCENILDCELPMLPDSKKSARQLYHGVVTLVWISMFPSWHLPADECNLDTIWSKYEDFCKPQVNEVRARFDLLTSFCQGNRSVDEWYNAVQAQMNLAKYPQETENILYHDIFWVFLERSRICVKNHQ